MTNNNDAIISWFEEAGSGTREYSIFVCRIPQATGGEEDLVGGNNIASFAITRTNGLRIGTTKNLTLDNNQRPCLAFENGNPAEINFVR